MTQMDTGTYNTHTPTARTGTPPGRTWTIVSFVLAALALVVFPPVLGLAGAIVGYVGHRKGDPKGSWAAIASVVAIVVGMVIGAALLAAMSGG